MTNLITRRDALKITAAVLAAPAFAASARAEQAPVLIELFTSQGCSDCPPADKLMGELKARSDVRVVSLNVDYWDYLGWKDTLGQAAYSKRQRDYAHARGDMEVYTPQVVINGERHAVGSNRSQVEAAIAAAKAGAVNVPVNVSDVAGQLEIKVGAHAGESGTLWLAGVSPEVSVAIGKGENTGASVMYHNVARRLVNAGTWDGTAKTFSLPKANVFTADCRSCIAFLERGSVGKVLGLASFTAS